MSKLNIQNNSQENNKKISTWRKGKRDLKTFYDVNLKRSTNIKTFLFGILLTFVIIFPFALILIQFYKAYIYNLNLTMLILTIGWVLIWLCNGLSNYFTIKLAKLYFKEDPKLQSVDEYAVFVYETFNPGFIIFSLIIIIVLFFGTIGA